jgi:hypothetical protein
VVSAMSRDSSPGSPEARHRHPLSASRPGQGRFLLPAAGDRLGSDRMAVALSWPAAGARTASMRAEMAAPIARSRSLVACW